MALREDRREQLVDGEFRFTAEDFRRIAATLHAAAGIALTETKATLVYSRLAKRLRALGLESFRDYCALVSGEDGLDERQKMIVALTTNVVGPFANRASWPPAAAALLRVTSSRQTQMVQASCRRGIMAGRVR